MPYVVKLMRMKMKMKMKMVLICLDVGFASLSFESMKGFSPLSGGASFTF
jgi:hypothetical protein